MRTKYQIFELDRVSVEGIETEVYKLCETENSWYDSLEVAESYLKATGNEYQDYVILPVYRLDY